MFKCLGGLYPTTFIFLLFETPILTLCLLAPRNTWCGNACFGAQVSSRYGTWYSERVILQFMCVGCWAGVTYLRYTVLTSPNKGETAVHCCDPTLSVLVMLVSRNVFHVVSALQSIACYSGYFTQLFNLVGGFCVNMAPCWSGPCHTHAWGANLLARGGGWSDDFWPV